ncbi:hypothetical protein ACH5RR_021597 [Cinchona calisaya]|uniref:Uncharacterized protein n=1 Tax=Cinchona calisaya TaxID=153742 RepID=A0ABD2ZJ15_9GENT
MIKEMPISKDSMEQQVFKYISKARRIEDLVRVILKGRKEKKTAHYITVETKIVEQSKQLLPWRLVLDRIEPPGARASVFDRIGISIQENGNLSSRSFAFQRVQWDSLPSQEHSSVLNRLSLPKS